jgi:hypothetical protein
MTRIIIELTGDDSLEEIQKLEKKNKIRIINKLNFNSSSLPGKPLNEQEFNEWITMAEESPELSINEAKTEWKNQKEAIKKNIR